jgi:hypothetical protein
MADSHPITTNVWLKVSNSFLNTSALRLYLEYGFKIIGIYQSGLMMILFELVASKVVKAGRNMERQVESCFLLPELKNNMLQLQPPSTSGILQLTSDDGQEVRINSIFHSY